METISLAAVPCLDMDVGVVGTEVQDSTAGGVCVAVGIIAGVFINTNTEVAASIG